MTSPLDILLERAKKRWPLLLPLCVPLFFGIIQQYFSLSFRETFWHWTFLSISGLLFIFSGILDRVFFPQKLHGLFPNIFLVVCGALFLTGALWRLKPVSLPKDRLIVAVAQFNPVSLGAVDEADNIQHRIYQELKNNHKGAPLEVKCLPGKVVGSGDQEKRKTAIQLTNTNRNSAHMVLWGDVRKDEEELFVEPHVTVVNHLPAASLEERTLQAYISCEPNKLQFKKRLSVEIADVVTVICGIAYCEAERWDAAIEVLRSVNSNEADFYKALSFYRSSIHKIDPKQDLRTSIDYFERILGNAGKSQQLPDDDLTRAAFSNRAYSLAELAEYSWPEEARGMLSEAIEAQRRSIQAFEDEKTSLPYAVGLYNLGVTLFKLAQTPGAENEKQLLEEALNHYHAALQIATKKRNLFLSGSIQKGLGTSLGLMGHLTDGREGIKLLEESVSHLQAALQKYTYNEFPRNWANIQAWLGIFYGEIGRYHRSEGRNFTKRGAEAFRMALSVLTKKNDPNSWALTKTNLGSLLCTLVVQTPPEDCNYRKNLYAESLKHHQDALDVFEMKNAPSKWALVKHNLGLTLDGMGCLAEGKDKADFFQKAVDSNMEAQKVYTRQDCPRHWVKSQQYLGSALYHLAKARNSRMILAEALDTYKASLDVAIKHVSPQTCARIESSLAETICYLGLLTEGEEGVKLLKQSASNYQKALHYFCEYGQLEEYVENKLSLAEVLVELGLRISAEDGAKYLKDAILLANDAKAIYMTKSDEKGVIKCKVIISRFEELLSKIDPKPIETSETL